MSDSSSQQSNNMDYGYLEPITPASSPRTFDGMQFTVSLKPKPSQNSSSSSVKKSSQVMAPQESILDLETPLSDRVQDLTIDEDLPDESFLDLDFPNLQDLEKDFEDAWNEQNANTSDVNMLKEQNTLKQNRQAGRINQYKISKPKIEAVIDSGTLITCHKCLINYRYNLSKVWIPSQNQPILVAPYTEVTKSHIHIATCPTCSFGTCLACGKAPHLEECVFSDSRVAWQTLCSIDEVVVNLRNTCPGLTMIHDTREVQPVFLRCLTKLMAAVSSSVTPTFGLQELLRKSMLLDLVADSMRNMTIDNIELSPLLIQIWEFLNMIAEHDELRILFFENRVEMKEKSLGLPKFIFPLILLPVQQSSRIDSYSPQKFYLWSLLQSCVKTVNQYLLVNHDDVWSAVILAERVLSVHKKLTGRVPAQAITAPITHPTQIVTGFAVGLKELYKTGAIRKMKSKQGPAQQEETIIEQPRKKRGYREPLSEKGQDERDAIRGKKRRNTVDK
ncbi:hypothetical protein DID88_001502 [Monilinia fructigena]|uniref:Uncharacterized protein n=1 Tax=Monilinia fructigena TaxID=38457 RepID=A0A395IYM8_9HELO|nr:hypothetical protein DID88_001502 [Monilinia fructigena]